MEAGHDGRNTKASVPSLAGLRMYLALLLTGWGLSAWVVRAGGVWAGSLLWPIPPFFDFGCYFERIKFLHQPQFWTAPGPTWNYPAPSIFVYQLFYSFNRASGSTQHQVFYGFLAYLVFVAIALFLAGLLLVKQLARRGVRTPFALVFAALSLLLCWPVYFGMERGNIEVFLDIGVACGLLAYMRRRYWLFACLVGVFGAGKLYPLILLAVLLPEWRWKEMLSGLGIAGVLTWFGSRWIGAAPAAAGHSDGVVRGIQNWVIEYSLTFEPGMELDHSFFGLLKRMLYGHTDHLAVWAVAYAVLASITMFFLFFRFAWRFPRPNRLLMVCVAAVLLPPTSFDYTLTLLVPVWAWFTLLSVAPGVSQRLQRCVLLVLAAFAGLFAPEAFLGWSGRIYPGQFKALLLVLLLALSALVRFPEDKDKVRGDVSGSLESLPTALPGKPAPAR